MVLIGAAAFFSGSEAALISLSRLHARGMIERGLRGSKAVVELLDDRNRFLTSVLIGNTIVLLAADSLATALFIHAGIPDGAVWSTIVMAALLLLFGEIVPKTIAVTNNERWALRLAPLLARIAWLMTPLVNAFLFLTYLIVRPFGISPVPHGPFVTEDDIRNARQRRCRAERARRRRARDDPLDHRVRRHDRARGDDAAARHGCGLGRRARRAGRSTSSSPKATRSCRSTRRRSTTSIGVVHDRELLIALAERDVCAHVTALADAPGHPRSGKQAHLATAARDADATSSRSRSSSTSTAARPAS